MNVKNMLRPGAKYPPSFYRQPPHQSRFARQLPPCGGKPVKRTQQAFPTQGGRWPFGVPNVTQRQRSRWGEDEQRSE